MTYDFSQRQQHSLSRTAHRLAGHYGHEWGGLPYGHAAVAWRVGGKQGVALATALLSTNEETGEQIGMSGIDGPDVDDDGCTYCHTTATGRTSWCGTGSYLGDWECTIRRPGGEVLVVSGSGYIRTGDPTRIEWRHAEAARHWLEGVRDVKVPPEEVLEMIRKGPSPAFDEAADMQLWSECADRCTEELKELLNEQAQRMRDQLEYDRQRAIDQYNAEPTEPEEA